MKKITLTILFICLLSFTGKAGHIAGGEIFYKYVSEGAAAGSKVYEVTLRLFRDCNPIPNQNGNPPPELPTSVIMGVFVNITNTAFNSNIPVERRSFSSITLRQPDQCIVNAPTVCYEVATYVTLIELPDNIAGYTIAYQVCCRINGLSNIFSGGVGATYVANIPGTAAIGTGNNSSPEFDVKDTVLVCQNKRFDLPFSAVDPDGDSLSYSFCDAYISSGGGAGNRPPDPPPYFPLSYTGNYSGISPLGTNVTINPSTGFISGIAPSGIINPGGASFFVVNVCIIEWRNKKQISEHRKDFVIKLSSCDFADAELPLDNRTCDGFNYTFSNLTNSSQVNSWYWDFGVNNITTDTSTQTSPTYRYADTGVYKVSLIVNRGQTCSDTAESTIYVFPGFTPDFETYDGCKDVPIQFTDKTTSAYGVPNFWFWDFNVPGAANDTSGLQNPQFSFTQNGTYFVKLLVGSTKGCLDTISKPVVINDKPPIRLSNDTLICNIDTLQLNASGQGTFAWSPNYNISNLTVSNPLVSPDVKTTYYVTLTLAPGCFNTDSVVVNVTDRVNILPMKDTTICRGDAVTFKPVSDGLYYSWSPPGLFTNPGIKNAVATPTQASTLFTVVSSIGKCINNTTVTVLTVPYPVVNAWPDKDVCYRDTITLTANGNASSWLWSPARFTSLPTGKTTRIFPLSTTNFILRGTDTLGCPKPVYDTVLVRVIPPVPAFAGNDTAVVVGQPLQLKASGAAFYEWSPSAYLSSPDVADPVALFDDRVEKFRYIVKAVTPEGCFAFDSVHIRIFKTAPTIFVPTAFTPNGDDLNDEFVPLAAGIAQIHYFRVFNRWGSELYSTTSLKSGWDGRFKGVDQEPGSYIWMVSGVDYTGKQIKLKGSVILIR